MEKDELFKVFDAELKKRGFTKKSSTWYLDEGEVIKVVNLQKSNFSKLYYLNLCTYFKAIENKEQFPKEQDCHIRTRLNNMLVNSPKGYDYLFDLEKLNISNDDYEKEIKECLLMNIIPQLELIKSKEGIMKMLEKQPAIRNSFSIKVKSFLGLPIQRPV